MMKMQAITDKHVAEIDQNPRGDKKVRVDWKSDRLDDQDFSDNRRAGQVTQNIPGHIAVIMDGNGRWARKRRALPRHARTSVRGQVQFARPWRLAAEAWRLTT